MAERAAARRRAEAKRESQKRERAGSHQPLKHFFDPQKKKSAYSEFVHRSNGVDFYRPLPVRSAAGGNQSLRPFDEASRAGMINALSLRRRSASRGGGSRLLLLRSTSNTLIR